jgi:hypothetical protein
VTRQRVFRRPDKFVPGRFDDWREVAEKLDQVEVYFGTSVSWPPYLRQRSESRPASFEQECEATLARRYVEVDATSGQPLIAPSEAELIARDLNQHPRLAVDALRRRLEKTAEPRAVLQAIEKALRAVEMDVDEHDSPFPTEADVPPDVGALHAWQAHFAQLLARVDGGEQLAAADRAFGHPALGDSRA